ncbi:hypothetical protein TNCV_2718931 [Trichonephila clavipes]|nr:hypothetical protein TNCV_2718931 [Trichonephila clavipes]
MQSLWSLKIDWNHELPSERAKEWHRFLEDFNSVGSICIGRCIVHPQVTRVELHGFADASEKCYGAVIYSRSQRNNSEVCNKFIANFRGEKKKTFRCPGNEPNGNHLNQDCATTGVQKGYKEFERK